MEDDSRDETMAGLKLEDVQQTMGVPRGGGDVSGLINLSPDFNRMGQRFHFCVRHTSSYSLTHLTSYTWRVNLVQ